MIINRKISRYFILLREIQPITTLHYQVQVQPPCRLLLINKKDYIKKRLINNDFCLESVLKSKMHNFSQKYNELSHKPHIKEGI